VFAKRASKGELLWPTVSNARSTPCVASVRRRGDVLVPSVPPAAKLRICIRQKSRHPLGLCSRVEQSVCLCAERVCTYIAHRVA
jgi:hypothetical protein